MDKDAVSENDGVARKCPGVKKTGGSQIKAGNADK